MAEVSWGGVDMGLAWSIAATRPRDLCSVTDCVGFDRSRVYDCAMFLIISRASEYGMLIFLDGRDVYGGQ